MKEIKEVIDLVRDSLDRGLARTENFEDNRFNKSYVRYHVGETDQTQYVAEVSGFEPPEISIARRLMQGNHNATFLARDESVNKEIFQMLTKIDLLTKEAGIDFGKHGAELAFAHVIPKLYTKEITIYQNDVVVTQDDVFKGISDSADVSEAAKLAMNAPYEDAAIIKLDAMGAYRPVLKVTVPDLFDPSATVAELQRRSLMGVKDMEKYASVELLTDDHEAIKMIGDASVFRMDGQDYRSKWGKIEVLNGFKGGPALQQSHIPELEHHSGSWMVTRKSDGRVIGEFYERSNLEKFNPDKVLIQTAAQYLAELNQKIVGAMSPEELKRSGIREDRLRSESKDGPGM